MVKWISLHAAARKGLPMLGRSLAKQKSNCLLFLGPFFGLTSGWWEPGCRKHTLGSVRGECWCMWTVGTSGVSLSSYRHQSSEAEREWGAWIQQCITTCSLHCCTLLLLLFLLISLFFFFSLSTGIITWGTYWKFWHAQIWNRSPIFSSILKVSFLFK